MNIYMQNGAPVSVNNIFCIGRNYAAHIAELGNQQQAQPLVFLKPRSALQLEGSPILLPRDQACITYGEIHYEAELVLLIGHGGKRIACENAMSHIAGYGLGLDLTARNLQNDAKEKGWPWAVAKGFDGSACVSKFLAADQLLNSVDCSFEMQLNDVVKQHGETKLMLFPIPYLIHYLSTVFTLAPGDLIFTGTPEGVGCLNHGDSVALDLEKKLQAYFTVA